MVDATVVGAGACGVVVGATRGDRVGWRVVGTKVVGTTVRTGTAVSEAVGEPVGSAVGLAGGSGVGASMLGIARQMLIRPLLFLAMPAELKTTRPRFTQ